MQSPAAQLRRLARHRYLLLMIAMVVAVELALAALLFFNTGLQFDDKIGIAAFTAVPLFVIALFQLSRALRLQRATFIKDYVSKFFTDETLYRIFHDLIYNYPSALFDDIDEIANKKKKYITDKDKPVFDCFEHLQNGRKEGERLYHPDFFQGSREEMLLDRLLGYLDVIGYYYHRGFLKMEDIAGSIGVYLAIIGERKVIRQYLDISRKEWARISKENEKKTLHSVAPFAYLRRLLHDFEEYNLHMSAKIQRVLDEIETP